jgi:hypothetical protein
LAEGKVAGAPADGGAPKSFGEGAGDAGGKSVTADFSGGDAKVDPGLAEGKAPATEVQAKGAFAQPAAEAGAPKAFGEGAADPGQRAVTGDFSGGEAKVDPSGLAETKGLEVPAGADPEAGKAFGEAPGDAGGKALEADLAGADAKVDPSGLAEGKPAGEPGAPRSSLPSEGVQAKGAFAQQGAEPGASDAIPPKSDAPGGAGSSLTEDVLPDEDRFRPRERRPGDLDPDIDPDAGDEGT